MSLEVLISNLRSHEMVLNADSAAQKKSKSVALQSTKTSSKALKTQLLDVEEESSADGQEEEMGEDEFALFTKFQQWARFKKKNFRGNSSRNSGGKKDEQKNCFNCKKPGHFIADCPKMSSKDKSKRYNSKKQQFKSKLKKSLMTTFEELPSEEEVEEDEEANLALMASTDSDVDSDDEPESDSEVADEGKYFRTNKTEPRSKWVPKTEIIYHSDLTSRKGYILPKMWKQVRCKGRKAYVLDIWLTSPQEYNKNLREEEDDYWDEYTINCKEFYRND
ncbi:serine/threonine protein kinase SRPK1 [Trifolium pratense]|uniref:Serine/threonine protein kinase SRPK1 n=1 Tax=Trifolium pratense TaxID=57577 RepID=A0A2K3LV80_TRIPR|nr:serine/threonine protein kinase SRPK1 [Trifolium pratense]